MRKNKNFKKLSKIIIKYFPFIFLIISIVLNCLFKINPPYNIASLNIVISLLPMIFTILVVSLSLPNNKIYGLELNNFRRIRKNNCFMFVEMIIITISIFALTTIFEILSFHICIWTLDCISIYYSIIFVLQEIPVLVNNQNKIKKIIKNASLNNDLSDYKEGKSSVGENLKTVWKHLVLKDGIVTTYNLLKDCKDKKDVLDSLLSLQNDFLFKCLDIKNYISKTNVYKPDGLDILDSIRMSFFNIENCLIFRDDFDISEIYGNSDRVYLLTRSVFCLQKICESFELEKYFEDNLCSLLRIMNMSLNYSNKFTKLKKQFYYSFLDLMIIYSISNNQFWFVKSLRDSSYNSLFNVGKDCYYFYLLMMLYYYSKVNISVPKAIKDKINLFVVEPSSGLNSDHSSMSKIYSNIINHLEISNMVTIINDILSISKDYNEPIYRPESKQSWCSSEGVFDKELIINCWMQMVLSNFENYHCENELIEAFKTISDNDLNLIYSTIGKYWMDEAGCFANYQGIKFNDFISQEPHIYLNFNEGSFIKTIFKMRESYYKTKIKEKINGLKTENKYDDEINLVIQSFNNKARNNIFYDKAINLDNEKLFQFTLLLNREFLDEELKIYINQLGTSIDNILFENIKNDKLINLSIINNDLIDAIGTKIIKDIDFKYTNKQYLLKNIKTDEITLNKLKNVKNVSNVFLPHCLLWCENSIKYKAEAYKENTIIRPLNNNEINYMIDNNYSLYNGLYKYSEYGNDSKSIFLTRDELYKIIEKNKVILVIVFKFKILLNYNKILILRKKY